MPIMRYMSKMGERSESFGGVGSRPIGPGQCLRKLPVASGISFPVTSGITNQPKSGL
jgi:hypothetical protein